MQLFNIMVYFKLLELKICTLRPSICRSYKLLPWQLLVKFLVQTPMVSAELLR